MSDSAHFRRTGHWLLRHEAQKCENADLAKAGAKVLDQMEQGLALLIGKRGARLLLVRALHAAQARHAFLRPVQIGSEAEGALAGLPETVVGQDPAEVYDGLAAVIAEALALLSDFIGTGLALRQVRRIWPALPREEAPLEEEVDHESA